MSGGPSVAYNFPRSYQYPFICRTGTGQPLGSYNKPNGTPASVIAGDVYTLSAEFDASNVTAGSPCFCVQTSSGSLIASASVAPGFVGPASVSWTASAGASILYPVFSLVGVTITVGGAFGVNQPMLNLGASIAPFTAAASVNKIPDPLFAHWYLGEWGSIPPEWVPLGGALYTVDQPALTVSASAGAGSITEYQAYLYTAAAYSAAGFTVGQSLGMVASTGLVSGNPTNIQMVNELDNGQYVPLIQVTQTNGSVSGWVVPGPTYPWFNVMVGTPRLNLNMWGASNTFSRIQVDNDADQLDDVADIGYVDTSSQIGNYNPALGTEFFATDASVSYRGTGPSWQALLGRADTDVLSTDLPAPGNTGDYFHATDTDQVWRDNGSRLTQILTSPTVADFAGAAPSGVVVEFPAIWTGVAGNWTLDESQVPSGWLYCLGQPLSVATYPDLFAVFGYTWTWQNTSTGKLVSGSGLTGDQGSTADYIPWGASAGNSSPSSVTTASYAAVTSGGTFCIPNLSPQATALGVPYNANTTMSTAATPVATVPIIKL